MPTHYRLYGNLVLYAFPYYHYLADYHCSWTPAWQLVANRTFMPGAVRGLPAHPAGSSMPRRLRWTAWRTWGGLLRYSYGSVITAPSCSWRDKHERTAAGGGQFCARTGCAGAPDPSSVP